MPTEIGWAGVFSKASAKRIQSQQGNKKIHPDLAEAIKIVEEMPKATDKKQHPWKRFHGSVHPVQPGVSWFILSQEGLVAAGALSASIDGWHIDDLSKVIASVLDAKFLETAQGNAHIWVYGTDHPDGSSFIPFGFYVTLDPNQWTLAFAWTWLRKTYNQITGKILFVKKWNIDQAQVEISFIAKLVNNLDENDLLRLLMSRAEQGKTPIWPCLLSIIQLCYHHICANISRVFKARKDLSPEMKLFGKQFVRGYLDLLEPCTDWSTLRSFIKWGKSITKLAYLPTPSTIGHTAQKIVRLKGVEDIISFQYHLEGS